MEERGDVMTDNQWDGMLKMVIMMLRRCKTKEQAIDELKVLVRDRKELDATLEELDRKEAGG